MAYVEDRIIHDADAHTMEPPEWLEPFASAEVVRYALDHFSIGDNERALADIEKARARQADPEFRAGAAAEVMLRKNYLAPGAWGFRLIAPRRSTIWVSPANSSSPPCRTRSSRKWSTKPSRIYTYATATAANRAQIAFCSGDPRLLPVCFDAAAIDRACGPARPPDHRRRRSGAAHPEPDAQAPRPQSRGLRPGVGYGPRSRHPGRDACRHPRVGDAAAASQQRPAARA